MKKYIFYFAALLAVCACHKIERGSEDGVLKVLEYCPAPGQFINYSKEASCQTAEEAVAYAEKCLKNGQMLTLGAFGGYITVKMPFQITNVPGVDFAISGNPFDGSSEPGIVWVSCDENGNGIADDRWYELKGSDEAERDYEVTYFRPEEPGDVHWTDNRGGSGVVKYLPDYHAQNYYPLWIKGDSYTLKGSLLTSKSVEDGGIWNNEPFGWGYVDNMGSDVVFKKGTEIYMYNTFDLDNAVDEDGNPVRLDKADFVKVQSAVQMNAGAIGEVSTEVFGFFNL